MSDRYSIVDSEILDDGRALRDTDIVDRLNEQDDDIQHWQALAGILVVALQGLLDEPYGCQLCDSGRPHNPAKGHMDDCPYEAARAAIAKAEARS